jgi:hypothetical protein
MPASGGHTTQVYEGILFHNNNQVLVDLKNKKKIDVFVNSYIIKRVFEVYRLTKKCTPILIQQG